MGQTDQLEGNVRTAIDKAGQAPVLSTILIFSFSLPIKIVDQGVYLAVYDLDLAPEGGLLMEVRARLSMAIFTFYGILRDWRMGGEASWSRCEAKEEAAEPRGVA